MDEIQSTLKTLAVAKDIEKMITEIRAAAGANLSPYLENLLKRTEIALEKDLRDLASTKN